MARSIYGRSETLKQYAAGLSQDAQANSLADFIAPRVVTGVANGQYKTFSDKNAFLAPDAARAVGGKARRISFGSGDAYFNCAPYALEVAIDEYERQAAGDDQELLEQAKTRAVVTQAILAHEKAHIAYRHSVELLLVDVMSALQWFNPAIWMLRADLQELHEYEADDAVLRSGANLREYQYLLIRKAVSKSGYSVANSFNHSILKNRITMMSKSKTPLSRGLRTLWAFPLVCLAIGLQAQTVYVQQDKDSEKNVSDKADGIVLIVGIGQDGKGVVTSAGKEMAIDDVEEYISGLQLTPGTAVEIAADASVPMGYINDVKDQLRGAKALKVIYKSPSSSDDVTRYLPPQVKKALKKTQKYPEELLPGVNREDIFIVRINSLDKYFFGNSVGVDDEEMVERAKSFLEEHGRNTHFSLRTDRATSFGAYYRIQSLLVRAYYEVRTQKAQSLYGKALAELSDEELQAIYELYPLSITE